MNALINGCKHNSLHSTSPEEGAARSLTFWFEMYQTAAYLGMDAVSMTVANSMLASMRREDYSTVFEFVETSGFTYLVDAWAEFVGNGASKFTINVIASFSSTQMECLLKSDGLDLLEDQVLRLLLIWRETSTDGLDLLEDQVLSLLLIWRETSKEVSEDIVTSLLQHVKLPFVHQESSVMNEAISLGLVSRDQQRIHGIFQDPSSGCAAHVLRSSNQFTIRKNKSNLDLLMEIQQAERARAMYPRMAMEHSFGFTRMLGLVNGRHSFEEVSSVRIDPNDNIVICGHSTAQLTDALAYEFPELETPFLEGMNTHKAFPASHSDQSLLDESGLKSLDVHDVRILVQHMLLLEEHLRLHPQVQSTYGLMGETEAEMVSFTTALEAHVSKQFHVDPGIGIELMRSAASLFPDIAQISHYVRHNRSLQSPLTICYDAPDVEVFRLSGDQGRSTLWTEVERHGNPSNPTVMIGASFT